MTQGIEERRLPLDFAPRSLQAFLGLDLAAFGAVVMLGWMLHLPRVVKLDATGQVVVFNAALMFFLGGVALCLGSPRPGNAMQRVLGGAVCIVAASMLLQDFVPQNLGLSWSALHVWLPRTWIRPPGTMNPNPALAFLCCGAALALMNGVRERRTAAFVYLLIVLAIAIPAFDLIANIIQLEWLYPGYQYWRMAFGTSCAMLVFALTVWLAWQRTTWMQAQPPLPADRKITYLAAWILAGLTLTTGVATFAMMQSRLEDAFGEERFALLKTRTTMANMMIEGKLSAMDFITSRPNLQRQLRKLADGRDREVSAATAGEVLLGFLKLGFSALAVRGPDGQELLRVGSFVTAPQLVVPLNTAAPAWLLWVNGQHVMRGERSITDSHGEIATLIAEQPMPQLSSFMLNDAEMGETGDVSLCARTGDRLFCFPQRIRTEVFDLPLTNADGEPFPMSRALKGETGIITTLDYRNRSVIAAFGPVGDLGLGIAIKIDLAELYAPIRERLAPVFFLMLLFAGLGVAAIRFQVAPLASRLLASEQQTQAANAALREQAGALAASERRFRDTIEYAPIGMAIASLQGRWTDVNQAFCEIVGYDKEELEQLAFQDLISPEDLRTELSHVDRLLRNEVRSYQRVTQYLRKDGGIAWVLMTASLLRDDLGEPLSLIVQILDITERKRAEEEIRQLNAGLKHRTEELTAANAELQTFSYSVAHDLRAPLRQITGFSRILMEEHGDQLSADARRYLDKVHQGARQMGHLVDDLLNLAQVGRQALSLQTASLDSILQTAREEIQPECSGRNIEWQIGALFTVECDRGLMTQVFVNLLSNALKYSRRSDPAIIQVGQMTIKRKQAVFVRDNGVGFDMRHAGKLFGVFERLHKTKDFEGTGVGLATVERIIRKHGGLIWAHAEQGKGATFFFTIGSAAS